MADNPTSSEVLEQLRRVLNSPQLKEKKKLEAFLTHVVDKVLHGEASQLKQTTIGAEALGVDVEQSSNVRVHAHRLRQALKQYYESEGRNDSVIISLPPGSYVPQFAYRVRRVARRRWEVPVAALLSLSAVLAVVAVAFHRAPRESPYSRLDRFSFGNGRNDSGSPAADGSLIVYASDQANGEEMDIWAAPSREPHKAFRITTAEGDELTPDISPDGKYVVYRSGVDGALYATAVRGGEARRLTDAGFSPRFSPDGSRVAFARIEDSGNAAVYVVPFTGGQPVRVSRGVHNASAPIWSPDGRRLMANGTSEGQRDSYDWWILDAEPNGANPVCVQAAAALQRAGVWAFDHRSIATDWDGNRVIGAAWGMLLEFQLDPKAGMAAGHVTKIHPGPDCSRARFLRKGAVERNLVITFEFSSTSLLSLDASGETPPRPLSNDESIDWPGDGPRFSVSGDGRRLAFGCMSKGWGVCVADVPPTTPATRVFTGFRHPLHFACDRDGGRLTYSGTSGDGKRGIWVRSAASGDVSELCQDCGDVRAWSPDQRRVLGVAEHELFEIDVDTRTRRTLLSDPAFDPIHALYSPDGRWIAASYGWKNRGIVGAIFPAQGAPQGSWIEIAEQPYGLALHWSEDGRALLFLARHSGRWCLWRRPINPATGRPTEPPRIVRHFHSSGQRALSGGRLAESGGHLIAAFTRLSSTVMIAGSAK